MKISLTCPTCTAIGMAENRPGGYFAPQILVPLQNNNLYDFTCQSGHHTLIVLQNSKHELLFESGILALKDGYYREAATSFAAALERFYEFMITALMLPEIKANSVGYTQLWKSVVNSSERQFGALSFLYFKAFGKTLLLFDNAFLKKYQLSLGGREPGNFRNAIVHQGTIPSYKEAVHYGEAVNKYMGDVLKATTINSEWKSIFLQTVSYPQESTYDSDNNMTIPIARNIYFINTPSYILSTDTGAPFEPASAYNPSFIDYMGK